MLILIMLTGLPASWIVFENILNKTRLTASTVLATSNVKHQQDIKRLKAKHKKEISRLKLKNQKEIAKIKIKERSKRLIASIPIIGTASLLWTANDEYEDYNQWLKDNPVGTADDYTAYKAGLLLEP